MSQRGKLSGAHFLVKALDAVIGRMNLENHGRVGRDGTLVIGQVCAVGGANLDKLGARRLHNVGNAEATADLDELAAAHDDLFTRGMGGQHQQYRGGIVIDDERVLGTGERSDQLRGVLLARPARTGVDAVLERAVPARDLGHSLGD